MVTIYVGFKFTPKIVNKILNFNNKITTSLQITCGAPQDPSFEPLLFLIYVNPLLANVVILYYQKTPGNILKVLMFADNTNLFYSHKNNNQFFIKGNEELKTG